ncbi:MAG TPA: hypothetical protein VJS44_01795 [Pyrinomonadaceae bacterium]|nr:hypothetical protein [Pyrinomonadaceae bacterium]
MDIAYLHVVLNHLPIIGIPIGLGLFLLEMLTKNGSIKRAALLVFVVLGLITVPVYLTGKGGEDFAEDVAGVLEANIEAHERMALFALISVGVLALFSLFVFLKYQGVNLFKRRASEETGPHDGDVSAISNSVLPGWVGLTVLVLALIASGVVGYTGKLGGKIRHTEFYGGAQGDRGEDITEEAEETGEGERGRNRRGRGRDR